MVGLDLVSSICKGYQACLKTSLNMTFFLTVLNAVVPIAAVCKSLRLLSYNLLLFL